MPIRVVLAGLGPRGRVWGERVRARDGFELVACVDPDAGTRGQAASELELSARQCFSQLEDALDGGPCDAVIVATAIDTHVEPCELALSRGIGVLVEKPFTLDLGDALKLVALGERTGAPIVVGQHYRYLRATRTARRLVRAGSLGPVGIVGAAVYSPRRTYPSALARTRDAVLWQVAVHHIDALAYVVDREITGVLAQSFSQPWAGAVNGASLQALLTLDGGIHATCTATFQSSGHEFFARGNETYLRLVGERATLHTLQRLLVLCERGKRPRIVPRGARPLTEEAILLDQLRSALDDGEEPDSSGRDNLKTIAALAACAQSSAERRWIDPRELLRTTAAHPDTAGG